MTKINERNKKVNPFRIALDCSEFLLSWRLIKILPHREYLRGQRPQLGTRHPLLLRLQRYTYRHCTFSCGRTPFYYGRQMRHLHLHLPVSAHFPSAVLFLRTSLGAPLLFVRWVPSTWNSSLPSSWLTSTILEDEVISSVTPFSLGRAPLPVQAELGASLQFSHSTQACLLYELTHSCFVTICFQVSFPLDLELGECRDRAFYLCVPRFGSNEWIHLRSDS